jgi:enoyl-CoA hydratase/carnithine racemase
MSAEEGDKWGFYNRLVAPEELLQQAQKLAAEIADGPTFAHGVTKTCLHQEWAMDIDSAIEAEAQAQAICMQTKDYGRAYRAFVAKQRPVFEGN